MNPERGVSGNLPSNDEPVVLCVDDEAQVLAAVRRSLRGECCEVITATSPAEALQWLERIQADIVLADERMPGMTGTALLAEVRRRSPRTARALLTGFPSAALVREGLEAGVDTFVFKPWDDRAFRETVRRLLSKGFRAGGPAEPVPAGGLPESPGGG